MAAVGELLDSHQAQALTGLWRDLLTQPAPPPAQPATTAAACPECGRPRPAPAAVFRTGEPKD
jgi:hypothetical protein